jgi:hypothetical protein
MEDWKPTFLKEVGFLLLQTLSLAATSSVCSSSKLPFDVLLKSTELSPAQAGGFNLTIDIKECILWVAAVRPVAVFDNWLVSGSSKPSTERR